MDSSFVKETALRLGAGIFGIGSIGRFKDALRQYIYKPTCLPQLRFRVEGRRGVEDTLLYLQKGMPAKAGNKD